MGTWEEGTCREQDEGEGTGTDTDTMDEGILEEEEERWGEMMLLRWWL